MRSTSSGNQLRCQFWKQIPKLFPSFVLTLQKRKDELKSIARHFKLNRSSHQTASWVYLYIAVTAKNRNSISKEIIMVPIQQKRLQQVSFPPAQVQLPPTFPVSRGRSQQPRIGTPTSRCPLLEASDLQHPDVSSKVNLAKRSLVFSCELSVLYIIFVVISFEFLKYFR